MNGGIPSSYLDEDVETFVVVLQGRLIHFEVAVDVSEVIMADRKCEEIPNRGQDLARFLETLERLLIAVQAGAEALPG